MFENKKRYNNFGSFLKNKFNEKVYKVCIDAGFTCPNRDGKKAVGGCIYCNNNSFKPNSTSKNTVTHQLNNGIAYLKKRYNCNKFIAYFQPYSNTYGDKEYIKSLYYEAISHPKVIGLSIGTRPDCINDDILKLFEELSKETYLWVEYGLQSMHDKTLEIINRGHTFKDFHKTYIETKAIPKVNICVHIIHGLPLETKNMMLDTVRYLSDIRINGIKIHQLHVVKNTLLERYYLDNKFSLPSLNEYLELLSESLELLPFDVIIQRLFGLGPLDLLVAPNWNIKKSEFNTLIDKYLESINTWQGKKYKEYYDSYLKVV